MLKELDLESQVISQEANSGAAGLVNAVDRLPKFAELVRSTFMGFVGMADEPHAPVNYSRLAKQIAQTRYTDMMPITVFAPPGLNTTYLNYIRSLELAEKDVLTIPSQIVAPFSVWVARLLSNPQELSSQRNHDEIQDMVVLDVTKLRDNIMGGINGSDKSTERTYGKVVSRNQDWGQIELRLEELNNHILAEDRMKVLKQVNELADNIDLIVAHSGEDHERYAFSSNVLSLLSSTCYNVAKILELYSVYCYQLRLLTVAIHDTQTKLTKLMPTLVKK